MKDLSIYIHIPFCVQKCIYCNFVSFCCDEHKIKKYFLKLEKEIIKESVKFKDYIVKSIFIGGGTPSVVDFEYINKIYQVIKQNFKFKQNMEFSIECNPNSITEQKIKKYLSIGINRFSIGLQSSDNNILKMLNRPHSQQDFCNAIKILKDNNVENFNVDILLGLPNQSLSILKQTLNFVLSFNPTSISAYGLIVEENTPLFNMINDGKLIPASEKESISHYDLVYKMLKKNGYKRYEVSNFSKKGKESIHNMVYWQNGDYIGFGLSAHSKIENFRFSNTDSLDEYLSNEHNYIEKYSLTKEDRFLERIMLSLRTEKGINIEEINQEFDIDFLSLKRKEIDLLTNNGFIYKKGKHLKASVKGFKVLNAIIDKLT